MSSQATNHFSAPFANKSTLNDVEILQFLKRNNIQANILTLEQFYNNPDSALAFTVLFTGNNKNEYNNGYTHHWLGLCGDYIFDSYGYQKDYKFPSDINFQFVKCFPSRLQEFDSNVCGEYVLSFIHFCQNYQLNSNVGRDYCYIFNFSRNRNKNDEIVLQWYSQNKKS